MADSNQYVDLNIEEQNVTSLAGVFALAGGGVLKPLTVPGSASHLTLFIPSSKLPAVSENISVAVPAQLGRLKTRTSGVASFNIAWTHLKTEHPSSTDIFKDFMLVTFLHEAGLRAGPWGIGTFKTNEVHVPVPLVPVHA